ncbi:MAG: 3-deoxy-D-manno-octulosonic acid transferase [Candidatus Binataceae bacterium]
MLTAIYNALWYPALPFALIASGGVNAADRRERMGGIPAVRGDKATPRIWVHAASVGEVEAVRGIIVGLQNEFQNLTAVVTTMTAAGREAARRRIPGVSACLLAPLDCKSSVRAFLAAVRPHLVLIAETEIWPNFFAESVRAGAKVVVINGRLSEHAMRRYRLARPLFAGALAHAHMILAQSADDAGRYQRLGAPAERIVVTGNTKFALDRGAPELRRALEDFVGGRRILIAGSTARGEERMVLTAYRNLCERFPELALVLAPRHLDRVAEVETELQTAGVAYVKATALSHSGTVRSRAAQAAGVPPVMLLDTMGELRALYRAAAIAFVGGSMIPPRGGQNLAEPAAALVPVLFGPYYENQRDMGNALIEGGGGRVVVDTGELESTCAEWLANEAARREAGQNARRVVEQMAGGTAATLMRLKALVRLV